MVTVLVTVAAGIGAISRYLVDGAVQRRTNNRFPFGTLAVNVSGSLLLGLLVGLSAHHGLATSTGAVLGAGFAGGYTTPSAWARGAVPVAQRGGRGGSPPHVIGQPGPREGGGAPRPRGAPARSARGRG